MKKWIEGAMQRAVLVMICILLIAAWGGVEAVRMQRDYLPGIANTTVIVSLKASSLQADQIRQMASLPLEDALRSVDGLTDIETDSYDGGLLMNLYFPMNFDMAQAERNIRQAVSVADLPDTLARPLVTRITTSSFPILSYSLTAVDGKLDETTLRSTAQADIVRQLATVPGVADVKVVGDAGSGYVLTVRMPDMAKYGLTADDVNKAIAAGIPAWPTGKVADGRLSVPVRVSGWKASDAELAALPVKNKMGVTVPLSAIADLSHALTDVKTVSRTNGKPSLLLDVIKTPSAGITDVEKRVKERIPQIPELRDGQAHLQLTLDRGSELDASLTGLLREGLLGCLFSMLCVLFFFRSVRSTLLIAVSLPISLLATTGLLGAMGMTLNILTVSGLIVAMGRIVDDAIVILDNMYRRAEEEPGQPMLHVLAAAVKEMVPAIFASTATTIAVYVPIAMVGGVVSASFSGFAWSVVIALAISFFTAMLVIPALGYRGWKGVPRQAVTLEPLMRPAIRWTLAHKRTVSLVSLLLFVAAASCAALIPANVLPGAQSGEIAIQAELPTGSAITDVDREVKTIEDTLRTDDRIASFSAVFGSTGTPQADDVFDQGGGFVQPPNVASLSVSLKSKKNVDGLIAELQQKLSAQTKGAVIAVSSQSIAGDDKQMKVLLSGGDAASLTQAEKLVRVALAGVAGFKVDGAADASGGAPKYRVTLQPDKLKQSGIKPEDVNAVLARYMTSVKDFAVPAPDALGGAYPVDVVTSRLAGSAGTGGPAALMAALGAETVAGADGKPVRIDQVTTIAVDPAPTSIRERNGQPFVAVTGQITSSDIGGVSSAIEQALKGLTLPAGVGYSLGGVSDQITQMIVDMAIAIAFSILLVLLITSTVFRGWRAPLAVLLSIPLALSGVVLVLLLLPGGAWNLAALIGLLMLTGIVVTNGIVLIDKIERNRRAGLPLEEAILDGSLSRVRPILMTAGTTVLTLLPLALTHSSDSVISQTLGIVVIGGMVTSTFNSLAVIPVFYGWLHRKDKRRQEGLA